MFNLKCNKKYICNKLLYEKKVKWKHLIQGKLKNVEKNIMKHMVLKLCSSDWDLNPWLLAETTHLILRLHHHFSVSQSVMSISLWPYGLQHTRLPISSPSPGICSNHSIESVMSSNHLILCCPLLFLPSIFPSIKVFSNELALSIRWAKY